MNLKQVIKAFLPPIVLDLKRRATNRNTLDDFRRKGKIPWSPGYATYKRQVIIQALEDPVLLDLFRTESPLPSNYGYGVDERCIEYPWLLSHLSAHAKSVLDAGSVLNHDFILSNRFVQNRKLHLLTLAPEHNCFWRKGISYIYDDLRSLPMRDHYYDAIVCLSTLEHVGCDNTSYTHNTSYERNRTYSVGNSEDIQSVMQELNRALKPGGSLFLSVPYGRYRNFGSFQQFDRALLSRATAAFGETSKNIETFYRYTEDGWQVSSDLLCADCKYVEWIAESWRHPQLPNPIPKEPDMAAAARAVACIHLVKPTKAFK